MRILVTGAAGLVGRAVVSHCVEQRVEVIALDHKLCDISEEEQISAVVTGARPDTVINCAAWTDVDGCEFDHERAHKVNALGPELLAKACARNNALLVTISTDYVFDGEQDGFYTQDDKPNPQSVYGLSKLNGERRAHAACAQTVIVRSGYIFGMGGANFLSTILPHALRGEKVKAISDTFGTPTYSGHLAQRLLELAHRKTPGVYHVVNSGDGASFEGFSRILAEVAHLNPGLIETIRSSDLDRPAKRPRNSRLRCLYSAKLGLKPLPTLTEAIQDYLDEYRKAQS